MTAPDPRLDEIQAIPADAVEAAAKAMREAFWSGDGDFENQARAALEAAHPYLLAELRKAHEALTEAQAKAYDKGYTHGRHDGELSHFSRAQRPPKSRKNPYRAAVAAAKGDERG